MVKMMVTSEETIKNLRNEVLRLKLIIHEKDRMLEQIGRPPGPDMDETKRDLIADLMTNNDELRKRIEEMEEQANERQREPEPMPEVIRVETFDVACQTKLDLANINQLLEDRLTLRRQREKEQQKQQTQARIPQYEPPQQYPPQFHTAGDELNYPFHHAQQPRQPHSYQSQQYQHQYVQHPQQDPRLHGMFSHNPPQAQTLQQNQRQSSHPLQFQHHHQQFGTKESQTATTNNRGMTADEKETLDKLFKLDGILTTARNRLRAIAYD